MGPCPMGSGGRAREAKICLVRRRRAAHPQPQTPRWQPPAPPRAPRRPHCARQCTRASTSKPHLRIGCRKLRAVAARSSSWRARSPTPSPPLFFFPQHRARPPTSARRGTCTICATPRPRVPLRFETSQRRGAVGGTRRLPPPTRSQLRTQSFPAAVRRARTPGTTPTRMIMRAPPHPHRPRCGRSSSPERISGKQSLFCPRFACVEFYSDLNTRFLDNSNGLINLRKRPELSEKSLCPAGKGVLRASSSRLSISDRCEAACGYAIATLRTQNHH